MNKTELIAAVAEKAGLTKKDVEKAISATLETVKEEVAKGGKVQVVKAVVKKSVKKNGITSAAETLGSTVAEINHNLFQLSKNIIKAYNDSISALMESQN